MVFEIDNDTVVMLKTAGFPCWRPVFWLSKFLLDLAAATLILLVVGPFMLVIALAVKTSSPGPALFIQKRLGFRGGTFRMYKFRTMVDRAWEKGTKLYVHERDWRITPVGCLLRALHLDELPQLFNVLSGSMSFVGPRPTMPFHADCYEDWERKRLEVLPGITGFAQVNGANSINWDERIKLDVWYVHNRSLWLDVFIVLKTVLQTFAGPANQRGIYSQTGPVWTRGNRRDALRTINRHGA